MAVGGVVTVAGSILPWASMSADIGIPVEEASTGLALDHGWLTLATGILLIVVGILAIAARAHRAAVAGGLLLSLFLVGFAVYDWVDIAGANGELTEDLRNLVSISIGVGLYAVVAGALIGVAGGAMGLFRGTSSTPR